MASAVPMEARAKAPGCGELNMIVAGLPPYHPLVTGQGFNATAVNAALRADAVNITKAGYNLRVVLFGPEQNISVLDNQMNGINWDGTGIGYGVRGSNLENLTVQFTNMVDLYRHRAPYAPMVFDHSPDSTLWAIQERFPLSSDCADSPGQDLGFNIFCDICSD
ncbi:hypothetical protein LTR10_023801 [Elasticomyces elasticus]|uniref:Uncharacterized protein n=1 Tax=Exophiala sideris TaxID=1016849 RepID=A0ABR0J5X7_9EURO|nr:hypothetical protein LTR10_023801 [Elasticomyces elasticus]KAK5028695.1 hypothetical protein LTS07_006074 [Exophiala sideris]KAK5035563.1 hypothetical protein LTR13_005692 [Exophiala sideris]KAK5057199.1 hypothetical protein LTR69_007238 [Exophiala sideris]